MQYPQVNTVAFLEKAAKRRNPISGEEYIFQVNTGLLIAKHGRTGTAYVALECIRGSQSVIVQHYSIEQMNCFSLIAFTDQYKNLLKEWTYSAEIATLVSQAEQAFREGTGPVIKVNTKAFARYEIEIVKD